MQTLHEILCRESRNKLQRAYLIYPMLILVFSIAVDYSRFLNFSLVPIICVLSLVIFSLYLPSRQLIIWTVIYMLAITVTLWIQRDRWATPYNNAEALVITRVIVASSAGTIACMYAMRRERDDVTYLSIIHLLEQFSIPATLSDSDGWLTHMNSEALKIFGENTTPDAPFYEYFSDTTNKGKSIQYYMNLASGATMEPQRIGLSLISKHHLVYSATMMRITLGARNLVLTLLDAPEKQP